MTRIIRSAPRQALSLLMAELIDEARRRCKREIAAVRKCYHTQRKKGNTDPAVRCEEYMRAQAFCMGKQLCLREYSSLPRTCTAACPWTTAACDVCVQPMQACLERILGEGWAGPQPKS